MKNIKNSLQFVFLLTFSAFFQAQTNNVGINTSAPEATLDIVKTNTTNSPIFRVGTTATNANHRFRVFNNGYQVFGTGNMSYPLTVYQLNDNVADFAVVDKDNSNVFLKHYHYNRNMLNNPGAELAGYGINFTTKTGHVLVFSSGGQDSGLFIGPVTDRASGIYIGENGKNGIGITSAPTETLDVGGNIKIGSESATNIVENGNCTKVGEIVYHTNFWGCTATGWKQLNN